MQSSRRSMGNPWCQQSLQVEKRYVRNRTFSPSLLGPFLRHSLKGSWKIGFVFFFPGRLRSGILSISGSFWMCFSDTACCCWHIVKTAFFCNSFYVITDFKGLRRLEFSLILAYFLVSFLSHSRCHFWRMVLGLLSKATNIRCKKQVRERGGGLTITSGLGLSSVLVHLAPDHREEAGGILGNWSRPAIQPRWRIDM